MPLPDLLAQLEATPGWMLILLGAALLGLAMARSAMGRAIAIAVAAPVAFVIVMQLAMANPWTNQLLIRLTGFEAPPSASAKPGKKPAAIRRMNLI